MTAPQHTAQLISCATAGCVAKIFYVPARPYPELCGACAELQERIEAKAAGVDLPVSFRDPGAGPMTAPQVHPLPPSSVVEAEEGHDCRHCGEPAAFRDLYDNAYLCATCVICDTFPPPVRVIRLSTPDALEAAMNAADLGGRVVGAATEDRADFTERQVRLVAAVATDAAHFARLAMGVE